MTVKKEKLNWAEANEDCQLINVSQLRSVYKTLTSELIVDEEYWIKDSVEEISVLIKGESRIMLQQKLIMNINLN